MYLQEVFQHNYMSAVTATAAYLMVMNYEQIMKAYGCCPAVILYSRTVGTGKTTALRIPAAIFGTQHMVR